MKVICFEFRTVFYCHDKQAFKIINVPKIMSKTIFITQESPANALALNKDYTNVVIAGRNGNVVLSLFLVVVIILELS